MRESQIERYLRDECARLGWLCLKFVSPGRAGVPDRIILSPKHVRFVEVKAEGGKVSKLQEYTFALFRKLGIPVTVVWSKDDVDRLLGET